MTLMTQNSVNPATGESLGEYSEFDDETLELRLAIASDAFRVWSETAVSERATRLRRLAGILCDDADALGTLATQEMGKPISQAVAEVQKCAKLCEYYASEGPGFLADRPETSGGADEIRSCVRYEPLGAVLAIMPWNFPYWQVFRCAVPAVLAGNVVLLKHASNVPSVSRRIEELFVRAGFPAGVVSTLLIGSDRGEQLIRHPVVQAVTLTGSESAGTAVAQVAGEQLKPTVMELGGSDPFIVLGDADPVHVAGQAARARCQNNGQSCIAAKRFFPEESIAEEFTEALVAAMQAQVVGDPLHEDTAVGPLAREDLRDTLHEQVVRSVDAGAEVLCGGSPTAGAGFYYPPTVVTGAREGMPVFDEETFGPVAAVTPVRDAGEAIHLANRSRFGLGSSLWTSRPEDVEPLTRRLESGCVFVNEIVRSDPRLPFGGIKKSGYGRELSREGIREFVNVKSVRVSRAPQQTGH